MSIIKRLAGIIGVTLYIAIMLLPIRCLAQVNIQFTSEEQKFIKNTQQGKPIAIGIIPHTFPLSTCPPETDEFMGMNIEMLEMISDISGLQFQYQRIPLEEVTPYQELQRGRLQLVAGTIKLDSFTNNLNLILSSRFCDGAAVCIAQSNTDVKILKTGKVATMVGYQAGVEFCERQFPNHEIVTYPNNQAVIAAVRNGEADLAMISRYVGVYELQSPFNENLVMLTPYQMLSDSCIMGMNTPDTALAIAIINKALMQIGDHEANHVQMNFSITHPYKFTPWEFIFKYRYMLLAALITASSLAVLIFKLLSSRKNSELLARDGLTGALTESGFELEVSRIIHKSNHNQRLFVTDFDISHFGNYNELHGREKGNELLREIVKIVRSFLCEQDAICRAYADNFRVLSSKATLGELVADIQKANVLFNQLVENRMAFKFGIYQIKDTTVPIRKMLDFAAMAKKNIKTNPNVYVGVFNNQLHERYVAEATLLSMFDCAMRSGEFVAYYQPKFDTMTRQVVGAEALVRWIRRDGSIVQPPQFIDLFEQNGLIQGVDFCMLKQVCILQQKLLAQGQLAVPISINFSRVHLFSSDFIVKFNRIVEAYGIPKHLIEIECTETAMAHNQEVSSAILGELRAQGFKIAMDDFGQAYSSLNTLRLMPLDIVKLDRGFLRVAHEEERIKAIKIIESMIALVHGLSLKMVSEGVETEEQYLFLKSVGCDYIQGYYFAKPMKEADFVQLLIDGNGI